VYTYNQLYFQYKKLYSNYLKKLTFILNTIHKKHYSLDYWEPIVGIYLRRFILNYLFFKNISKNKNLFKLTNYNNHNFSRSYREYSDINDFLTINEIKFYKIKTSENFKISNFNKLNLSSRIHNSFKTIIPNILINLKITKNLFSESYFKKSLKNSFVLKSFFYFYPLPNLKLENYPILKKKILQNRLGLIKKFEIKFKKDMLFKNLLFNMPVNYIENYNLIFDEIEKLSIAEGIYVDGNEISFDFIKFYIAKIRLNKKKVFSGQHSLRNGLDDYDVFFDYTKSISSYFLTWGWSNKLNIIKKFSSLRLFSSLKKYKKIQKIDEKVLTVCFILCGFSNAGECLYDNFIENEKAEKARIDLLQSIRKQKKMKIFLKPRTGSFLLNDTKKYYKQFEILKDKTRMYDIFGKFSIIIFERMSLGIVENIYLNQPTIFYYPKKLYQLKNKNYKNLFNLLKKANILFDDKKKVEQIINSQKNISEWWFDKKNVQIRKKLLKEFANSFEYSDLSKLKKLV
jgi:putative transferase (TIGR04331 family)